MVQVLTAKIKIYLENSKLFDNFGNNFANLPNPGTFTEILSQSSVVRVRDFRVLLRLRGLKRSFLLNITDWTDPLWFSRWSLMKEILTKCQRVTGEGALWENPSWRNCHPWRMICNEIFIPIKTLRTRESVHLLGELCLELDRENLPDLSPVKVHWRSPIRLNV